MIRVDKYINLTCFVVALSLVVISVKGANIPVDKDIYANVGRFVVRPYSYGIYLSQTPSGIFYNFSPYDAYYEQNKEKLIKWQEPPIVSKESKLKKDTNAIETLFHSVLSYFGIRNPTATFEQQDANVIKISSIIEKNRLVVTLSSKIDRPFTSTILTMSFNDSDKFTDVTNESPIHIDMSKNSRFLGKRLAIYNPNTLGVIVIETDSSYNDSVYINTTNKLIEIKSKTNPPSTELHLFNSMEEALW